MVSMCSIPLCKGVSSKHVKLHKFARSENLRRIWLDRIKLYYPNFKISKSSLVCSKHFADIYLIKSARSKTFSLHKDAVPSLFDVDKCVHVFSESDLDGESNIPSPSFVDVLQVTPTKMSDSSNISGLSITDVREITPTKMSDISNISEPSKIDVIEVKQGLDIQVPVTPKKETNTTNNSVERKAVLGGFNFDDLNNPKIRILYWDISQKTVKNNKCKIKKLRSKNDLLTKRINNFRQLINQLEEERTFSDNRSCP